MTLIVLSAVIMNRRALTMRNLAFAVLAVVAVEPEVILGVSFQLSFAAGPRWSGLWIPRIAGLDVDPDPFVPKRGAPPKSGFVGAHFIEKPLALLIATAFATSATASFMAYFFMISASYVLIGNLLTPIVIEVFAVLGARCSAPRSIRSGSTGQFGSMSGRASSSSCGSRVSLRRRPHRRCI